MSNHSINFKFNRLHIRWLIGLLGLIFWVAGQAKIATEFLPAVKPLALGEWLNKELFLAIPSIDNVLKGLPLLVLGGLLLAISFRGIPLLPSSNEVWDHKPLALRFLRSAWPWLVAAMGLFVLLLWRINVPEFNNLQLPLWITSLLIFASIMAIWDRHRAIDLSPHLARVDLLWISGLLLAGVVLGTYRLQGLPDQLMGDEGSFWNIARSLADESFKPSIFATGVYTFPILSSYLPAWLIRLFGIDLWGWRFSSLLIGLFTVPPLYLLAREVFNRKLAIASSIILITSPYFLVFTRLGYNNIQALCVVTSALYWLFIGINRKSSLYLFLAGCAAGLGFYVYFAARFAIVISIAFILLLWIQRKINLPESIHALIVILFALALMVTPYILYGRQHDAQALSYKMWESAFFNTFNGLQFYPEEELYAVAPPFTINGNELFYNPRIYLELISRGFLRTMLVFQKPWLVSEHYLAYPLAGSVGAVFYVIGLMLAFRNIRQPRNLLLLLWFFANVLGLSTLNTVPPRHTHMVAIIPALAILTAMGVYALVNGIASLQKKIPNLRVALLVVGITLTALGGISDYFVRMPPLYLPQPDQILLWAGLDTKGESLHYVYTDPAEKEYVPYLVRDYRKSILINVVSQEELENAQAAFPVDTPTLVFFPPKIREAVWEYLRAEWGSNLIKRTFLSTNGTPVLAAGMNTHFVFEREKSFSRILKESYLRLSLGFLILALGLLFILFAYFPHKWLTRFPIPIRRFTDWFNAPGRPAPPEEEAGFEWADLNQTPTSEQQVVPQEPPEWALETFPTKSSAGRLRLEIKPARTNEGTDLYIKLSLPRFVSHKKTALAGQEIPGERPGFSLPPLLIPNAFLLISAIAMAIAAQILIDLESPLFGVLLYLAGAAGLLFWIHQHPKWRPVFTRQLTIASRAETLLFVLMMIVMAVFRFYDLGYRVYGLEADETKWTVQSWYSAILRVDRGEFGGWVYRSLPLEFWIRSIFLRIFGLDFISARVESACLSLISVAFLYLLVRMLTSSPSVAFLATILYGFAFSELNASHQALHNTPVEPWIMSGLFFLIWGVRKRRWWQFQVAGILLSMGMLVYDTFYPTAAVGLTYLLIVATHEIIKKKASPRDWFRYLLIFIWPFVLVYLGFIQGFLPGRQFYYFGWLRETVQGSDLLKETAGYLLGNFTNYFTTIFSHVVFTDSLIRWSGPVVNTWALPFIMIGIAYSIGNINRPGYGFILLWYFLQTLAGPIIIGSVWPRVMFTSLAPLMIWGALGLWITLAGLRTWLGSISNRIAIPLFALLVAAIVIKDYLIFSTSLVDPEERQKRRELADLTNTSAKENDFLVFPFMIHQGDSVIDESHVILFSVAGAHGNGLAAEGQYSQVQYEQLLETLWQHREISSLGLVVDKSAKTMLAERDQVLQVVLGCYPQAELSREGSFFDVYNFSEPGLQEPACYQAPAPQILGPGKMATFPPDTPMTFSWVPGVIPTTGFSLNVERRKQGLYWLEAESFEGAGWWPSAEFISGYTGDGFLLDDWHAGESTLSFNLPAEENYRVWIRSYKRVENDQHNFFNIAGQSLEFAENGRPLAEWTWQDLGSFLLPSGKLPLSFTRTYGQDEQYSVFIDNVVLTTDQQFNPAMDNIWETVVDTGEVGGEASQYKLQEILPAGVYRWKVRVYDGDRLVDSTGARGVESSESMFMIGP